MAVLIEGISVVVRCQAIVDKFVGGVEAFFLNSPESTFCMDGELACVHFMVPADVRSYVERLTGRGLIFKESNQAVDIVVVDQRQGPTVHCLWIEFSRANLDGNPLFPIAVCQLIASRIQTVSLPLNWSHATSLSAIGEFVSGNDIPGTLRFVRREGDIDILSDTVRGEEFRVRRNREIV